MAFFSTLITQIGLPFLIDLVSSSLKGSENKTLQKAGETLDQTIKTVDSNSLENTSIDLVKVKELELEQEKFLQVNETYRSEVASSDPYVRRMRPTFGYIMAATWAAQMLSIAYVVIVTPDVAGHVIEAFGALSMIWSVGLSVLGIYVYNRSQEKRGQNQDQKIMDKIGAVFKRNT